MSSSSISRLLPVTALALLAAAPAFAQQKLVPAESSVGFVSRQMGVPVEGHFRKFDGQITFDPAVITYTDLLHIFFTIHDPTTLNRQGADVGTQYRSAIVTTSPAQQAEAAAVIQELNAAGLWSDPIVTQVEPLTTFFPAEDYHQEYFVHHPGQGYCTIVIQPKVAKFRQKYQQFLKS